MTKTTRDNTFARGERALNLFEALLGRDDGTNETLNWETINPPRHNLQHLDEDYTEEDIREVVMEIKPDKALVPDSYIGKFFKSCWDIIKDDFILAVQFFYNLHGQHFNRSYYFDT
jgi:hypothetical protein